MFTLPFFLSITLSSSWQYQPLGLSKKLSAEKAARYKIVELKNGRAAMIAMASMFAFESIPGSVPLMDLFGAN